MRAKILIVEDEAIIADDLQLTLEQFGYEVPPPVDSGEAALVAAAQHKPDLVLLDIRIRGALDGVEVAARLRETHPIPIIFLTAHADEQTLQRAGQVAPAGYLLKPFQSRELRAAIEIALIKHGQDIALLERERWFATTLQSIGDAVLATDARGRLIFMNQVAAQILGWQLDEAIGQPIDEIFCLVDAKGQRHSSPVTQVLASGLMIHLESDSSVITRGGARRAVDDSAAPIRDERGELLGAVVVFRDVTEERQLERRLVQSERMAAIGTLAAGMVHEINNPLSYVIANVEMALTALRDTQRAHPALAPTIMELEELLRESLHGANRVRDIVSDLRHFSRADTIRHTLIDLHRVLDEAVRLTEHQVKPLGALHRDYGVLPYVSGNPGQLSQVFVNLITNAAHALHTKRNGQIWLRTRTDERGGALIEVIDNGVGIPDEALERVFDPFFTTRDSQTGMGLGLSLSLNVCHEHGGDIHVSSVPGGGSTFTVSLPPAHQARQSPLLGVAALPSAARHAARASVLVIDDEPHVARALGRVLTAHHDVTTLTSARAALEALMGGARFDVIITDLLMPEMTGMELYARICEYNIAHAASVLFTSGGAFTEEAARFAKEHASRVLQKPFDAEDLLALVDELLLSVVQ